MTGPTQYNHEVRMCTMLVRTSFPTVVRINGSVAVPFVAGVIVARVIVAGVGISRRYCCTAFGCAAFRRDDGGSFDCVCMIDSL